MELVAETGEFQLPTPLASANQHVDFSKGDILVFFRNAKKSDDMTKVNDLRIYHDNTTTMILTKLDNTLQGRWREAHLFDHVLH